MCRLILSVGIVSYDCISDDRGISNTVTGVVQVTFVTAPINDLQGYFSEYKEDPSHRD